MRHLHFLTLSLLLLPGLAASHGFPQTPDLSRVGRGEKVPTVMVEVVVGEPGEPDAEVILRAARRLDDFTRQTGFEGCALMCKSGDGRLAVPLRTNFSHVGCLGVRVDHFKPGMPIISDCPTGFSETGERIHSHPNIQRVRANPVDAVFADVRRGRGINVIPDTFSERDLGNGPGSYLVALGRLLYFGDDGVREVARLNHASQRSTIAP